MSIEMEIPKVLWLKNNMPSKIFERCKFYDLADALTHIATGKETRSFCSTVCKQGYVPVGVDGSVKGWQDDFLTAIGLQDLAKDNFKKMGGVNGAVCSSTPVNVFVIDISGRMASGLLLVKSSEIFAKSLRTSSD
jgi:ribulose kinase